MALKRKTVKKKVATCVKILVQKLFEIKKHYKLHSFITDFNRKYFLSGVANFYFNKIEKVTRSFHYGF